jgi:hypothetical protein
MAIPRNLANIAPHVAGSSGGITGLTFNATQSASAGANTLDDYEEGTWTPAFNDVTISYNSQSGKYIKIGNLVHIEGILDVSSLNTADTSGNSIFLPFAAGSLKASSITVVADTGVSHLSQLVGLVGFVNDTFVRFGQSNTKPPQYSTASAWNSSGTFYFAGSYYID